MTGKALSALLATLKRAGVVEYQTKDIHLRLDAGVPLAEPVAKATREEAAPPDDDPPPRDWRFALEDLSNLNNAANRGKLGS